MKLTFPIIGLNEHKIGLNTPINNISSRGYVFCSDETRNTHGEVEQVFLLTKSIHILSREVTLRLYTNLDLKISLFVLIHMKTIS